MGPGSRPTTRLSRLWTSRVAGGGPGHLGQRHHRSHGGGERGVHHDVARFRWSDTRWRRPPRRWRARWHARRRTRPAADADRRERDRSPRRPGPVPAVPSDSMAVLAVPGLTPPAGPQGQLEPHRAGQRRGRAGRPGSPRARRRTRLPAAGRRSGARASSSAGQDGFEDVDLAGDVEVVRPRGETRVDHGLRRRRERPGAVRHHVDALERATQRGGVRQVDGAMFEFEALAQCPEPPLVASRDARGARPARPPVPPPGVPCSRTRRRSSSSCATSVLGSDRGHPTGTLCRRSPRRAREPGERRREERSGHGRPEQGQRTRSCGRDRVREPVLRQSPRPTVRAGRSGVVRRGHRQGPHQSHSRSGPSTAPSAASSPTAGGQHGHPQPRPGRGVPARQHPAVRDRRSARTTGARLADKMQAPLTTRRGRRGRCPPWTASWPTTSAPSPPRSDGSPPTTSTPRS